MDEYKNTINNNNKNVFLSLLRVCVNFIKIDFYFHTEAYGGGNYKILNDDKLDEITNKFSQLISNLSLFSVKVDCLLKLHLYVIEGWIFSRFLKSNLLFDQQTIVTLSELLNDLFMTLIIGKKHLLEFATVSIREVFVIVNQFIQVNSKNSVHLFFLGSYIQLLLNGPGLGGDEFFFYQFHEMVNQYFIKIQIDSYFP